MQCDPGEACEDGTCECLSGLTACVGGCYDLQTDVLHCGGCDTACDPDPDHGVPACESGACTVVCDAGYGECNGDLTDGCEVATSANESHCGGCGVACPTGATCEAGVCVCPVGEIACGGTCVNPQTDMLNCGQCDVVCPAEASCQAGTCACPSTETVCGTQCVDLMSDPTSCGSCGHDCQGGDCQDGLCQAVVLASGLTTPSMVAIDDSHVYWTDVDEGALYRIDRDGGVLEQVVSGPGAGWHFVLDGDWAYWSEWSEQTGSTGRVFRVDKSGGTAELVWEDPEAIGPMAVEGGTHYWVRWIAGSTTFESWVLRVDDPGQAPVELGTTSKRIQKVVVRDGYVYGHQSLGTPRFPTSGGSVEYVFTPPGMISDIAVDASHIYGAMDYWPDPPYRIGRVPLAGGAMETLFPMNMAGCMRVALDSETYWFSEGNWLYQGAKLGGAPVLRAISDEIWRIVADDTCLFWIEQWNGRVMKLVK